MESPVELLLVQASVVVVFLSYPLMDSAGFLDATCVAGINENGEEATNFQKGGGGIQGG